MGCSFNTTSLLEAPFLPLGVWHLRVQNCYHQESPVWAAWILFLVTKLWSTSGNDEFYLIFSVKNHENMYFACLIKVRACDQVRVLTWMDSQHKSMKRSYGQDKIFLRKQSWDCSKNSKQNGQLRPERWIIGKRCNGHSQIFFFFIAGVISCILWS